MNDFITHSAIRERMSDGVLQGRVDDSIVRRLWWAALETLQEDILLPMELSAGLWVASPLPALYDSRLLEQLQGWVWAPDQLEGFLLPQGGLLPPAQVRTVKEETHLGFGSYKCFPLREDDGQDPLLLIITSELQVALAIKGEPGKRQLLMRSDPETLSDLLAMLDKRLNQEDPQEALALRDKLSSLGRLKSNLDLEKIFWPLVSERLAGMAPSLTLQPLQETSSSNPSNEEISSELTLLEALTHEVRTPLSTIRTLIRSLLRRKDLPEVVFTRLKQIDVECTQQIDRFGLIFNAAELQRQPSSEKSLLARTDLGEMLVMLNPVWSQQLESRGQTLLLDITPDLPQVLSDSERLEPMLGGLIDRCSRGLPSGSSLSLLLRAAGHRLKLQILTHVPNASKNSSSDNFSNSELGPVLSWNPNTGSLQLSQAATQRMLASLGGRLTHRRDRDLTIFFPIEHEN
ncbi:sensor histidine kinase [Prochlorococcus sp. MIT 1300]|uniref:sensor histidine kinase n=1 Tax=Prochlorococcus sp. MIT 1300 TaxID=3096218 RepID=UPI002A74F593|nr:sensor histidine kinase [Prochlorococcus sp. MIT 1300]